VRLISTQSSDTIVRLPTHGAVNGGSPDLRLAEANHRIANNLMLIGGLLGMQADALKKSGAVMSAEGSRRLIEEVRVRIETVGRLHRLLSRPAIGSTLDLGHYLADIVKAAIASLSAAGAVALDVSECAACEAPPQQAMSIGFIVGELATNAVKYAHPAGVAGRIALSCRRHDDGSVVIRLSDDGVGLPEGFDPHTSQGLGMRMMRTLTTQLGASLVFNPSGLGLTVELSVPPPGPDELTGET
jgi:two-component sensor histidine kinase